MTFRDFWTNENNPKLDKAEYLYGTRHLVVLLVVVVLAVMLSIWFENKSQKAKRNLMCVLAGILLFFEIASRIVNLIVIKDHSFGRIIKTLLPLEMCSVVVWGFIVAVFSKKQLLIDFSTIGGLFATLAFLLFPSVGLNRTYMSFTCIYSTVSHMIGFIGCVLMMTLGFCRFEMKKIWQVYLCFAVMFLWGALFDFIVFPGSNYMFLAEDPLELGMAVPYQIVYGLIIAVYIFMFYLISYFKHKRRKTIS